MILRQRENQLQLVILLAFALVGCTSRTGSISARQQEQQGLQQTKESEDKDEEKGRIKCHLLDLYEDKSEYQIIEQAVLEDKNFVFELYLSGTTDEAYVNINLYDEKEIRIIEAGTRVNNRGGQFHLVVETDVPYEKVSACEFDIYGPEPSQVVLQQGNELEGKDESKGLLRCYLIDSYEDNTEYQITKQAVLEDENFTFELVLSGATNEVYANMFLFDEREHKLGEWGARAKNRGSQFHLVIESDIPLETVSACEFDFYGPK